MDIRLFLDKIKKDKISPQIEEEKEKKKQAKKDERAQKRKKEKEAASKETEPSAKKARQVKSKIQFCQFRVQSSIPL